MTMTLSEINETCKNWEKFCDKYGWSYWAVNEGGGDVRQHLTLEEARELGILREESSW